MARVFYRTSVLDVDVTLRCHRSRARLPPRALTPFPIMMNSGKPTMVELYRIIKERFDRSDKQFDELTEKMRATNQRLAGLQHEDRQPRLAKEAD